MLLKSAFLLYVEKQRSANWTRDQKGSEHPETYQAYSDANDHKRLVLDMIENIEES
jgi:hypothetical protein